MQLERGAEREDKALINYTENKAERGKDKGKNVLKFRLKKKKGARNGKKITDP